jgi:hypothetical protein
MYPHILAWTGFAFLLLLCLPFSGTRKLVLEVSSWALRLALLTLLTGGAVLWFRPDLLPAEVGSVLDALPGVRDLLPLPQSQTFGLAAAALVTVVFLPLLAVLDVTRKLAGQRLRLLRPVADATRSSTTPLAATEPVPVVPRAPVASPAPAQRRADRRAAADTMAEVGSRKPFRVADQVHDLPASQA